MSTVTDNLPPSSEEPHCIPAGRTWEGDWELARDLWVEIRTTSEETLAVTRLTEEEYGAGTSLEEAVQDLLTSLSDYRECLEEREERLGATAAADLWKLREVIRRRSPRQDIR